MNLPNRYIQGVSMTGCLARLPSKALTYTLSFFWRNVRRRNP